MARFFEGTELEHRIDELFPVDEGPPCPEGKALLRTFAEHRPADFAFLRPRDFVDLCNSGFEGIAEWDARAKHFASCELCNA